MLKVSATNLVRCFYFVLLPPSVLEQIPKKNHFRLTDSWRIINSKIIWNDNTVLQWHGTPFSNEKSSATFVENFIGWAWWNRNTEKIER